MGNHHRALLLHPYPRRYRKRQIPHAHMKDLITLSFSRLKQLTHLPVAAATLLTATAFASRPGSLPIAELIHVSCWVAQFYGHGVHERRAPALLDNLLGGKVFFSSHPP